MKSPTRCDLQCPVPINEYPKVLLAHGGGGRGDAQFDPKNVCQIFW